MLNTNNKSFHTYADPLSKKLSIVIKDVHQSFTEDQILAELVSKNFQVVKVNRLHNKEGQPIPVVSVIIVKENRWQDIFKLNRLCHAVVRVEQRKRLPGPVQCSRCQDYNHTKNYCNRKIHCAICTGNHFTKDCKEPSNFVPVCSNCKVKGHRANVRSNVCSYYDKIAKSKSNKNGKGTKNPPSTNNNINNNNNNNNNFTYQAREFPGLPFTNNIPNFNFSTRSQNPPPASTNVNDASSNSSTNNANGNFNLSEFLTSHIVNFFGRLIQSFLPTLIDNIKTSILSSIFQNHV